MESDRPNDERVTEGFFGRHAQLKNTLWPLKLDGTPNPPSPPPTPLHHLHPRRPRPPWPRPARLKELNQDARYYENIEGGQGGAANNKQAAYMQSLGYAFLIKQLFPAQSQIQIKD
jgi:hypothetical protein